MDGGFAEIKWFVDLLYAVEKWKIDWSKVLDIAEQWGIQTDIVPGIATLNHHWHADIPFTDEAKAIDLQTLVIGKHDREKEYYTNLPASYLERLMRLRKLPDKTSQVRYLFHLFFPTQENLRWRYGLSSKWSVVPYYFFHPLFTLRKFLTGLWYELVYHPR